MTGDSAIEALSSDECLAYLAESQVGRVAVSTGALPAIYTVLFALHNGRVVLRVAPHSRLYQALCQAVVAFSADHFDEVTQEGWSVLVQGIGEEATQPDLVDSLRSLPLRSWADPSESDSFISISLDLVSGMRARRANQVPGATQPLVVHSAQ